VYDLGSPLLRWQNGYYSRTLVAPLMSASTGFWSTNGTLYGITNVVLGLGTPGIVLPGIQSDGSGVHFRYFSGADVLHYHPLSCRNVQVGGDLYVGCTGSGAPPVYEGQKVLTNEPAFEIFASTPLVGSWGDKLDIQPVTNSTYWSGMFTNASTFTGIRGKMETGSAVCDVIKQNWTNGTGNYSTVYTGATFSVIATFIPLTNLPIASGDLIGFICTNIPAGSTGLWAQLEYTQP
jgi:hypothetical protein